MCVSSTACLLVGWLAGMFVIALDAWPSLSVYRTAIHCTVPLYIPVVWYVFDYTSFMCSLYHIYVWIHRYSLTVSRSKLNYYWLQSMWVATLHRHWCSYLATFNIVLHAWLYDNCLMYGIHTSWSLHVLCVLYVHTYNCHANCHANCNAAIGCVQVNCSLYSCKLFVYCVCVYALKQALSVHANVRLHIQIQKDDNDPIQISCMHAHM